KPTRGKRQTASRPAFFKMKAIHETPETISTVQASATSGLATTRFAHTSQGRHADRRTPRISLAATIICVAALLPLAFIGWITLQTGWTTSITLIFRARVAELLINTACLIVIAVPICAALSIGLAWLTERSDLPGARFWAWIGTAPLAVPAFIHGYAWVTLL